MRIGVATLVSVLLSSGLPALAQAPPPPLPQKAKDRLDRMIGTWESRWDYLDREGNVRRSVTGTETMRYLVEGRVIDDGKTWRRGVLQHMRRVQR